MAISGRSALESLTMFGLKNDGPLNTGGLGAKPLAIEGVTTADKLVRTPRPVKAKKAVADKVAEASRTVADITEPVADNLSRDAKYKQAHAAKIKERDKQRKAAKRAEQKAKT